MRSYLVGGRTPGVRNSPQDPFGPYVPYCQQRLRDDPHLEATVLLKEITELGYQGGYSTLTRALRRNHLRPACTQCRYTAPGQDTGDTPADGDELRFTWLKLPEPPPRWGAGSHAHVLVGSLPSGRWRAALAENENLPQVIEAIDLVLRRLGRTGCSWRFDSLPAAKCQTNGRVKPELLKVARYYGTAISNGCPCHSIPPSPLLDPLRPIEDFWWRTVDPDTRLQTAQGSLDHLAAWLDLRHPEVEHPDRAGDVVSEIRDADKRDLALPPAPFPAWIQVARTVTSHDLVPFRGNHYAVSPGLVGAGVEVSWRLDEPYLSISTTRGAVIARHTLAPRGAGRIVSGPGHAITLGRSQSRAHEDRAPSSGATRLPPPRAARAHGECQINGANLLVS
ncbi:IS21 family transposase [Kitasatospora sp. NPDC051914]|uniref:Mu transposase domain-containing protein n=1 Tax=Kitasatospora sp. NPDC051914 TaxID=3154945 RepID=UPI0034247EFD